MFSRLKADLIVMGAYGHRPSKARMLGGATRGLLAAITVPVLMSHLCEPPRGSEMSAEQDRAIPDHD